MMVHRTPDELLRDGDNTDKAIRTAEELEENDKKEAVRRRRAVKRYADSAYMHARIKEALQKYRSRLDEDIAKSSGV